MRSVAFAAVCFLLFGPLAKADVLYSFVGAKDLAGTTFTIDSPNFFGYSANNVPVTSGEVVLPHDGGDFGAATDVRFYSDGNLAVENARNGASFTFAYNVAEDGTYTDYYGVLTISGTPAITTTPEPGSFALLGTGLLGVVGVMKRRLV